MPNTKRDPRTFVEMVLILLEDRFPWLGSEEEVSGADTVQDLSQLHSDLVKAAQSAAPQQPRACCLKACHAHS
jgi:hypothetical protein